MEKMQELRRAKHALNLLQNEKEIVGIYLENMDIK